jgi:PAS domain S-box-containing protein
MDYLQATDEALKQHNIMLQATLENYRDVLVCSIDRQYRCLVFNHAFAQAINQAYGTEVELGKSLLDYITNSDDRLKAKRSFDGALAGKAHFSLESYGELNRRYYEIRFAPIRNAGTIDGATITATDITERKQTEEKLLLLNSEFENFSYSVTHDLRAPLRSINGFASILLEDFSESLSEEGKKNVHIICRSAKKMNHLIDDLLTFSRLGRASFYPELVDSAMLVKNVVEELSIKSPNAREVIHIMPMVPAMADRNLLRQVWLELLSNALKYSRNKTLPHIEVSCIQALDEVIYCVSDNGTGFDMNYQDKLFAIFQRLHNEQEFEGTGVGLASVQKIIHRHQGRIWAESKPNKGSSFFFALPKGK